MNLVYTLVGIILAFAWAIFLLNEQRDEIISLKAQLSICQDFERDVNESNKDLTQCIADVDYLQRGLEQVISASKKM